MRLGLRGVVLMLGFIAGSVAACTLWVDNQFKDYSGTCQLMNANANECGQCGTTNCRQQIDQTCGESITFDVDRCFGDPSYNQSTWQCQWLLDDAAVNDPTQSPNDYALRTCMQSNCMTPCTKCTDFDAGVGPCGDCLRGNCARLMDNVNGCCSDEDINTNMVACASSVAHTCAPFLTYDAGLDPDTAPPQQGQGGYCMYAFSMCVQNHCASECM